MGSSAGRAMEPYEARFVYKGEVYDTVLDEGDLYCMINGVRIEVEFDGALYIEYPDQYEEDQLDFFAHIKHHDIFVLTDYLFQYCLPVRVREKDSGQELKTCLLGTIEHDGVGHYSWTILSACSSMDDVEYAIFDLQKQLGWAHLLEICCCCQYGESNPYGGDPYLNFLCFRKNKEGYAALGGNVEKKDWPFFTDEKNAESTRPLYHCADFAFRESLLKEQSDR